MIDWDDDGRLIDTLRTQPLAPRRTVHLDETRADVAASRLRDWALEADMVVTSTVNGPERLFDAINEACADRILPWLRGNCTAERVEVGPYVLPGQGGCFTCMRMRAASIQDFGIEGHFYQERLATVRPAGTTPPLGECLPFAAVAASLIASEVVRTAAGISPPTLLNSVLSFLPLSNQFATHHFLPVPRCPTCRRAGSTS